MRRVIPANLIGRNVLGAVDSLIEKKQWDILVYHVVKFSSWLNLW